MARNVKVDTRQIEQLSKQFKGLGRNGLAHATRNTLNTAAFSTREKYVEQMRSKLVLRNTWTMRGVAVERATGTKPGNVQASVGSVREYMDEVESGHTEQVQGKHGVAIATTVAAGQSKGAGARTRPVRRGNYLAAITLKRATPKNPTGGRAQRNVVAVKEAAAAGRKFTFLERSQGGGIFAVTGRKKFNVRMVWDISRRTLRVAPRPLLETAVDAVVRTLPDLALRELEKQAQKFGKK
jgi:hypothetical protein